MRIVDRMRVKMKRVEISAYMLASWAAGLSEVRKLLRRKMLPDDFLHDSRVQYLGEIENQIATKLCEPSPEDSDREAD